MKKGKPIASRDLDEIEFIMTVFLPKIRDVFMYSRSYGMSFEDAVAAINEIIEEYDSSLEERPWQTNS